MPASRKRVSRSPYQSSRPDTKNSVANAAVRIALTFWPALNRPCGRWRSPARKRRVVPVEEVDLADGLRDRAPVAEHGDQQDRARPRDPRPEVDVLDQRSPGDGRREGREVEDESGAEQDEERARVHPVEQPLGQGEALDVTARARRGGVGRASIAIRAPHPRVDVVAALLPVARAGLLDELDPLHPLHVLVAVHLRDHDPGGSAVLAGERLAVQLVGEHHVAEPDLAALQVVVVGLLGRDETQRLRPAAWVSPRRADRGSGRRPSGPA